MPALSAKKTTINLDTAMRSISLKRQNWKLILVLSLPDPGAVDPVLP